MFREKPPHRNQREKVGGGELSPLISYTHLIEKVVRNLIYLFKIKKYIYSVI